MYDTPALPQLTADVFLTDGGIETSLIFDDGIDLPDFAAFTLLDDDRGRDALSRYFQRYAEIAASAGLGAVLETPTWRASSDWGARQGYDAAGLDGVNRRAVSLVREIADRFVRSGTPIVTIGCVGPRGDGYQPGSLMTAAEAEHYHSHQVRSLAAGGAELITAITMLYPDEAIGIVEAARSAGLAAVISFTVETDGALPTGQPLGEAIAAVDDATGSYPAYYMVNCAHPTHFGPALDAGADWTARLGGVRANASKMSHAELDAADELDAGNPEELAGEYRELRERFPNLRVLGGCCGTNHLHIEAIAAACAPATAG